jgi:hypothetical protein
LILAVVIEASENATLTAAQDHLHNGALWPELWVSLASLLRSYTAAHGLNRKQQATVELGQELIVVRAGERWLQLTRRGAAVVWSRESLATGQLTFTEDGLLQDASGETEEMDMQAEAWARELMR